MCNQILYDIIERLSFIYNIKLFINYMHIYYYIIIIIIIIIDSIMIIIEQNFKQ